LQPIFFLGFLIEDLQPPAMVDQYFIAIYRRIFPIHKSHGQLSPKEIGQKAESEVRANAPTKSLPT